MVSLKAEVLKEPYQCIEGKKRAHGRPSNLGGRWKSIQRHQDKRIAQKMKPNAEFALRITDFFKTSSRADK